MSKSQALEARLHKIGLGLDEFSWDRPLVGISGNFREGDCTLAKAYYYSILEAGATPVIIPPCDDESALKSLLDALDGLVFSGGADIDPGYMDQEPLDGISINKERDEAELMLADMAFRRHIPMLGICRGMQLIAVGLGGKMYQDIRTQHGPDSLEHSQLGQRYETSHSVHVSEGSLLHSLFGKDTLQVNSFHHQAVCRVPEGFSIAATAPDGVIEAMESSSMRDILAVQWHPECFLMNGDRSMMPVFEWLVSKARLMKRARRLHDSTIILDSHQDGPMFFDKGARFSDSNPGIDVEWEYVGDPSPDGKPTFAYNPLVDLHKMTYGRLDAAFMVAYLKQESRDAEALEQACRKADRLLDLIDDRIGACAPYAALACSPDDLIENKRRGVKSIVKGIENGYAIGLDISRIDHYRNRGVAYMTLCHNGDNDLCDSAKGNGEHGGLSELGRMAIARMNACGMMVDLSHASEKSFYDALECSSKPIICSHSSSRALCDHPRNLTDEQMKSLAAAGGVAQVCLYQGFLKKDGHTTVQDAVRHILHMVEVMGVDHVGIGSDFDGGGGMPGLEDATWYISLTRRLMENGLDGNDLARIWGLNFLDVWKRNLE